MDQLPAAGCRQQSTETAKEALTWGQSGARPPTPERLKRYQHYARQPPGAITRHFTSARDDDAGSAASRVFGCRTKASAQSAAECMAGYPDSELARWKLEQSESVYASTRQAPLGQTPSRHYRMPDGLGTTIACGRPLHVREQERKNSTQSIIFPAAADTTAAGDDNAATHKMYVASHSAFAPGEQRSRDYDWSKPAIDPQTHRFGLVDRSRQCSVKQILQPDLDLEGAGQQQRVCSEAYTRHKATLGDELGRARVLGAAPTARLGADFVFGRPSARDQEPGVGELLRGGNYSKEQLLSDPGLGKSITRWQHTRNEQTSTTGGQARSPVVHASSQSTARHVLAPPCCVGLGVKEEHLLQLRSAQEIQQLLASAGIGMQAGEFGAVFELAAAAEGADGQHASLEGLMAARSIWLRQQAGLE